MRSAVVIPNWNGASWLAGCLDAVAAQTRPFDEVVVVDGASTDESLAVLADHPLAPRVVQLGANRGFGAASNRGIAAVDSDAVALVNTDVVLAPDWLERALGALARHPDGAAIATKMVRLDDEGLIDDTGDFLGRDGAAIQRGKELRDTGRWDAPEEVWGACAGAALYRREALLEVGGFDERFFMYLEDVDLSLRLRLAGWTCRYEPVLARHASRGSSRRLSRPLAGWVARNTLLLVAKSFPLRWAPYVLYRQLGLARQAARERALLAHLRGLVVALPLLPGILRERSRLRRSARVPIEQVIPPHPIRGPRPLGGGAAHDCSVLQRGGRRPSKPTARAMGGRYKARRCPREAHHADGDAPGAALLPLPRTLSPHFG